MQILLRIVAAITAVDALMVAGLAIPVALDAHRRRRELRDLEQLWHLDPRAPIVHLRRTLGRRLAAVAVAAALICSATAAASPQARRMLATSLEPVVRQLRSQPGPEERAALPATVPGRSPAGSTVAPKDRPAKRGGHGTPVVAAQPAPETPHLTPASSSRTVVGPSVVGGVSTAPTEIEVGWSDVTGEVGFRVERSLDGVTRWVDVVTTGADVTAFDDTGLAPGTTYYYRVFATGPDGDSPPSDVVSATTEVVPTTPPTVTAASGPLNEIDLTWADVDGETGYRIERSLDGVGGWSPIATAGQDVTTYADTGLSPHTTYFYRIVATGPFGDSLPSDVVSASTTMHPVSSKGGGEEPAADLTL